MPNSDEQDQQHTEPEKSKEDKPITEGERKEAAVNTTSSASPPMTSPPPAVERPKAPARPGARGTAAMDPKTRQEVARKGGLAVSRNRLHMAEIGRKGGQTVSKNREHMARIGRKGGAASRGHR